MGLKGKKAEELLEKIDKAFGLTVGDFETDLEHHLVPVYTKWGDEKSFISLADLGDHSLKISKNIGHVYIEKIKTDNWVVVGKGTTLHCDDIDAGQGVELDFEGFLM